MYYLILEDEVTMYCIDNDLLLIMPQYTQAEIDALTPSINDYVYNTDDEDVYCFDGEEWIME